MFADVQLETDRLIVRPFKADDAEPLYRVVSQEEVMRYLPEDVMTREDVGHTIAWLMRVYGENTPERIVKWTLAVVWKQDGCVIGWCGLGPLEFSPNEIELFYGLSPEHWGSGIATEASLAVLRYGFAEIGLPRIVAVTHPENVGSVRVLGKLQMTFVRVVTGLPEEHRWYEGCHYYTLARDDSRRSLPSSVQRDTLHVRNPRG